MYLGERQCAEYWNWTLIVLQSLESRPLVRFCDQYDAEWPWAWVCTFTAWLLAEQSFNFIVLRSSLLVVVYKTISEQESILNKNSGLLINCSMLHRVRVCLACNFLLILDSKVYCRSINMVVVVKSLYVELQGWDSFQLQDWATRLSFFYTSSIRLWCSAVAVYASGCQSIVRDYMYVYWLSVDQQNIHVNRTLHASGAFHAGWRKRNWHNSMKHLQT